MLKNCPTCNAIDQVAAVGPILQLSPYSRSQTTGFVMGGGNVTPVMGQTLYEDTKLQGIQAHIKGWQEAVLPQMGKVRRSLVVAGSWAALGAGALAYFAWGNYERSRLGDILCNGYFLDNPMLERDGCIADLNLGALGYTTPALVLLIASAVLGFMSLLKAGRLRTAPQSPEVAARYRRRVNGWYCLRCSRPFEDQ